MAWLRFHTARARWPTDPAERALRAGRRRRRARAALDRFAQGTHEYPRPLDHADRCSHAGLPGAADRRCAAPASMASMAAPRWPLPRQISSSSGSRQPRQLSRAASTCCSPATARCIGLPRTTRITERGALMYVAVKGGEAAIANAHRLLADRRRGDRSRAGDRHRPDRRAARRSPSTASWAKARSTTASWRRSPSSRRAAT